MGNEPRRTGTYLFVREGAGAPVRLPQRPDDDPPPRFGRPAEGARVRRVPTPLDPRRISPRSALHFDPSGALAQAIYQAAQVLMETRGGGLFAVLPASPGEAEAEQALELGCELAVAAAYAHRTVLVDAHPRAHIVAARYGLPTANGLTELLETRRRAPETPIDLLGVHLGLSMFVRGEGDRPTDLSAAAGIFHDLVGYASLVVLTGLTPADPLWAAARPVMRGVVLVGREEVLEQVSRRRGAWGDLPLATLAVEDASKGLQHSA